MKNHTVEIPELFLIQIAAAGKMGSGELSAGIRAWAQKECKKHNLEDKLKKQQLCILEQTKKNLENALGKEAMVNINSTIDTLTKHLKK